MSDYIINILGVPYIFSQKLFNYQCDNLIHINPTFRKIKRIRDKISIKKYFMYIRTEEHFCLDWYCKYSNEPHQTLRRKAKYK